MNGLPDQPWHAEAIRLDALGTPKEEIAFVVGRSLYTVQKLLPPGTRANLQERLRRRHHRRMEDPVWRERERLRHRARRARQKEAAPCPSIKTISRDTSATPTPGP